MTGKWLAGATGNWEKLRLGRAGVPLPAHRGPANQWKFHRLGAESLPEFFQSLATARGEKANTRLFVKRYRATHYPQGSIEYDFVWTTQLVKDLKY
jgi:hypothetical protein